MAPYDSDSEKAIANIQKYHVTFQQAYRAIQDPERIIFYDRANSGYNKYGFWETRWKVIGKAGRRILFVSYCERNGEIRIIRSRRATKAEKRRYKSRKEGSNL